MLKNPVRYAAYGKYVKVFRMQSENNTAITHTIACTAEGVWSCSCPRWTMNANRPECKHIAHVKQFMANNPRLDLEPAQPIDAPIQKALGRFAAIEL
jgi:hypothetical protein